MQPQIQVITLAVADLERSLRFYRDGLGLETPGIVGTEFAETATDAAGAVTMFQLDGGLTLALYERTNLAKDAGVATPEQAVAADVAFSIGHIVESKSAVDEVLAQAARAGAVVSGGPRERPWGIYSGYFRDPDGHLWEVIWNPGEAGQAS